MLKLVIIDDEVEICDFMKNFFKERKFEVFTAYNGKEALDLIDTENPDIILLDVRMPLMNGIQVLEELKLRDKSYNIIMVTAVEDLDKVEKAKSFGVIEYITKPLSLEQLEQSVFTLAERIDKDFTRRN